MSVIKGHVRRSQVQTNKTNHSAAIGAQITAQINSKNGNYKIEDFLPYPQAQIRGLDLNHHVIGTILSTADQLPASLQGLVKHADLMSRLSSTYYWNSGGFIYS